CAAPYNSLGNNGYDGYDSPDRRYVTDTISSDFKDAGGALNPTSGLYLHTATGPQTSCIQAGGNTSYSEALRQARAELTAHGRANIPDYIIFLTDGEANIGSVYGATYPPNNADDHQPCHTAINLANTYKAQGVTIYSIGYALGSNVNCTAGAFHKKNSSGNWVDGCTAGTAGGYHYAGNNNESPAITSYNTLSQIASPGDFYNQPNAAQLN